MHFIDIPDVVLSNFVLYLLLVFSGYIAARFVFAKALISDVDVLMFLGLTLSLSASLLTLLYVEEYIDVANFSLMLAAMGLFMMGITLPFSLGGGRLLSRPGSEKGRVRLVNFFASHGIRTAYILGVAYLCLGMFFAYLMFGASMPDERILHAKNYRMLDQLRLTIGQMLVLLCMAGYLATKRRSYIAWLVVGVIISFLQGSKSFLLAYLLTFPLAFWLVRSEKTLGFKYIAKVAPWAGLVLFSAAFVKMIYGEDFFQAVDGILVRIAATADIYLYAFVNGDIEAIYGYYEPLSYLLHPITSIFGVRGYDLPLGAELFGRVRGDYQGYGPNPHLPILFMALFEGKVGPLLLFSFLSGLAVAGIRISVCYLVRFSTMNEHLKLHLLVIGFLGAPMAYFDIGGFQMMMVMNLLMGSCFALLDKVELEYLRRAQHFEGRY